MAQRLLSLSQKGLVGKWNKFTYILQIHEDFYNQKYRDFKLVFVPCRIGKSRNIFTLFVAQGKFNSWLSYGLMAQLILVMYKFTGHDLDITPPCCNLLKPDHI